ncbi:MAG: SPASM domain-containing protein [Smithella sp.]
MQISLEGPDANFNDQVRGEGNFIRVVAAIQMLRENHIDVSIMNTLNRGNVSAIQDIVNLAADLGAGCISFERLIPAGNGKSMVGQMLISSELRDAFQIISKLALQEKRLRVLTYRPLFALFGSDASLGAMCSIGTNALTIMHDGTVFPCRRLPLPLGNILDEGLFKIWYDSKILWEIRDCRNLKGKCNGCDIISSCRGCRAMAYSVTGDYLAEDPQCWI